MASTSLPVDSATAVEVESAASRHIPKTTIILIRHGARYDYADQKRWKERCEALALEPSDPPLSALGHRQARETAAAVAELPRFDWEKPDLILASPYLRVLQTAQPLAHALGLPIMVEHCAAELHHTPAKVPPPSARVPFIPEVDETYVPILDRDCRGLDEDGKEPAVAYFRRLLLLAHDLRTEYEGRTVAIYSHAASVALVGALTGCATLAEAGKFAPCGIWRLASSDGGATWAVEATGDHNDPHVTENDGTTYPWGFSDSRKHAEMEAAWEEAVKLGPAGV